MIHPPPTPSKESSHGDEGPRSHLPHGENNPRQRPVLTLPSVDKALLKQDKMDVLLVEPSLETCKLTLKRWEGSKVGHPSSQSALYVLGSGDGGWNKVVLRNELRKGNSLGVWSFRIGVAEHELCFAIALLDDTENEHDGGGEEGGQDLLNISPGYFSESGWIDSFYDDDSD